MTPRMVQASARLAGSTVLATQSDERLVALARHGNERAFEALVERYRGPLLRYCGKLLPNSRAEDAVQQAFLNAHTAISTGEIEEALNFRPWLYKIAHNASLNLLRQNGWKYDQLSEEFDGVQRPDQAVEERERLEVVVAAIQALPERQRNAIVLREIEGRSYESVAAELGVSSGGARQLLRRARGTLRGAVSAIIPPQLLVRLSDGAGSGGLTRASEAFAGAGGVAVLAKAAVSVVAVGAIVVGAEEAHIGGGFGKRVEANVAHQIEATAVSHAGVATLITGAPSDAGQRAAHGRTPGAKGVSSNPLAAAIPGGNGKGLKTGGTSAPVGGVLGVVGPGAPTSTGDTGSEKVSTGIGTSTGGSGSSGSGSSGSGKTETGKGGSGQTGSSGGGSTGSSGSGGSTGKTETGNSNGSGKTQTGKGEPNGGSGGQGNAGNGSGNANGNVNGQGGSGESKGQSGSGSGPGNSGNGNANGQGGGDSKGGSGGGKGKSG
jgi:RNA polymerase sigma factor (sigma-70 family)